MFFANQNFSVHLIDMRGFGYSGGNRFNSSLSELHQDLVTVIKLMNPKMPLFLYGHSLGATIIMSFLINNPLPISGVILSAPLWKINPVQKSVNRRFRIWFLRLFGEFFEDFVISNSINPSALTKNNYYIKKHLDDKLGVTYLGSKLVSDIIKTQNWINWRLFKFSYPVLFIHGSEDTESDLEDTRKVFNKIPSRDKEFKLVENSYHEPFIDYEKETYKTD